MWVEHFVPCSSPLPSGWQGFVISPGPPESHMSPDSGCPLDYGPLVGLRDMKSQILFPCLPKSATSEPELFNGRVYRWHLHIYDRCSTRWLIVFYQIVQTYDRIKEDVFTLKLKIMWMWSNTCVALTELSWAALRCSWCLPSSEAVMGAAQDLLQLMESSTEDKTCWSFVHVTPPPPSGQEVWVPHTRGD